MCELQRINNNSSNRASDSWLLSALNTLPANWVRRNSWGWWDEWDDTVLQTQDSKFEPWRSEAEHATSRSRRLPTILSFTRGWGRNIFVFFKPPRPGTEPRTLACSSVKGSGANHYPRASALWLMKVFKYRRCHYSAITTICVCQMIL